MKTLKKYWPSITHAAAVAILFVAPGVSALAAAHPKSSAGILLVWGWVLHWAQSPNRLAGSTF